jgi:hypothetical protein
MAPEMMCHPGHDCDIKGGSDFHIVMTMNQAKALATLADAFDSYDLTPHSGDSSFENLSENVTCGKHALLSTYLCL